MRVSLVAALRRTPVGYLGVPVANPFILYQLRVLCGYLQWTKRSRIQQEEEIKAQATLLALRRKVAMVRSWLRDLVPVGRGGTLCRVSRQALWLT